MPILPTKPNVLKSIYLKHLMSRGIDRRLALHLTALRLNLYLPAGPCLATIS